MVKTYSVELDEERHPLLVTENEVVYGVKMFDSSRVIVELCNDALRLNRRAEEHAIMIALDTKCQMQGIFELSHGSVSGSYCSPREAYVRACLVGAKYIVIAHNHPSGICAPSEQDIKCARQFKKAGEIMDIRLLDFIIVGKDEFYSMMEDKKL